MPSEAFNAVVALLREQPVLDAPWTERREAMEQAAEAMPPPADVAFEPVDAGGVSGEWVTAPGADAGRAVLYLHGGGYVICSPRTHRRLTAALSRAARARVLAIDYRLAPEHPFPAAVDDAVRAWEWLLGQVPPTSTAIGGDSAGGGLAVATLVRVRDEGAPLPRCGVLISPWTDLEVTGGSVSAKQEVDPMIDPVRLKESAELYLGGADPRHPLASPIHADLRRLPPLLVHVGDHEVLLDDAKRLVDRARAAGVEVELEVAPEMIHVWHIFAGIVPEADQAVERLGTFIDRHLSG